MNIKWICPVCQKTNDKWKCYCGFDESKNYEKYKVITPLSEESRRDYVFQKQNKAHFYDLYIKGIPIFYLKQAAMSGDEKAQYELGRLYYDGIIEKDRKKALYWWKRAKKKENESSLKNKLGLKYMKMGAEYREKFQQVEELKKELKEKEAIILEERERYKEQSKKLQQVEKELIDLKTAHADGENTNKKSKEQKQIGKKKKKNQDIQIKIGSKIYFGKDDREWIVLNKRDDKILIITKDIVEMKEYHKEGVNITWEECSIRKWLNGEFLKQNFSPEERNKIDLTLVKNSDNSEWGTIGGRDTKDKIFCLSIEEAKWYFKDDTARMLPLSWWWLRSPGLYNNFAAAVIQAGCVSECGYNVDSQYGGVRPALWLNF